MTWLDILQYPIAIALPWLGLWLGIRYMRSDFDAKAHDPELRGRYIGYRGTWER